MSLTVLRLGIDTLEASIGGPLESDAAYALAVMKAQAQEQDCPQLALLDGMEFAVQAQGAKPYRYKLAGDEATIRLTDSDKLPGASIRLSSLGLAIYEPQVLYELMVQIVRKWFGPAGLTKLSRLDVAADFQGFNPAELGDARFVCRAKFRPVYPNIESPETYQFGKGSPVVRVYNKTRELQVSGKSWLPMLWAQHPGYDPAADVWRFEVQLRRNELRELGYPSPVPAIEDMAAILRWGLGWADLRVCDGQSSDRWERHAAWEELATAAASHTTVQRQALQEGLAPLSRIVAAVAGYAISAGAGLDILDFEQLWTILGDEVRTQLLDQDFGRAVRQRQIERLGKGDAA